MTGLAFRSRPTRAALERHYRDVRDVHLRQLFAEDKKRGERLTIETAGVYLDCSENRVTDETLRLLLRLARNCGLRERIDTMFSRDPINVSENRAVLRVAVRAPRNATFVHQERSVVSGVQAVLDKTADFSQRLRRGVWNGHTGKPIRNIVNIGIGGSDLGPVMAHEALRHDSERNLTFVSNVHAGDFAGAVRDLDPAETLFIVSWNTVTTLETMTNAHRARDWLLADGRGNCLALRRIRRSLRDGAAIGRRPRPVLKQDAIRQWRHRRVHRCSSE